MTTETRATPGSIEWANKHFKGAFSTDKRRKRRVIEFAAKMKDSPGKSIPQLCETSYDVKATYNLLKHNESRPYLLQRGHLNMVKDQIQKPGTYLLIEDDSEFSWNWKDPIEGLGPSGDFRDGQQGFMLHTTLALAWQDSEAFQQTKRPPLEALGIADQQYYTRKPGKKKTERKQGAPDSLEIKETDAWFHSMKHIGAKPEDSSIRWIRVCDRRADIFEQFEYADILGYDFIIRSAQDRALENMEVGSGACKLSNYIEKMPVLGQVEIELRGRKKVQGRVAIANISAAQITIRPPFRKGLKRSEQKAYSCQCVYVKEAGKIPKGEQPIEWLLLSSLSINKFEDARAIVRQYTCRWIIEEFHKTLKSGLKAEELQLQHADRIYATISIMSVVAVSLVELRELVRLRPDAPVKEANISHFEVKILEKRLQREIITIKDAVLAIGRLGGHMNRKRDGLPGLITLWRGWTSLKALCEGARLVVDDNFFEKFG